MTENGLPSWHIAVLIPARNEAELLPRCLSSVERARKNLPEGTTSDVIVVSDGSSDRTLEMATTLVGDRGVVASTNFRCVGSARGFAAALAISRKPTQGGLHHCWLANTDADCEVPDTWLKDQLVLARQGLVALAGIVDVDDFSEHSAGVEDRFRKSYEIGWDGSHPHVHGANLGVRADAYLNVGGWRALETAEDHDLWDRLRPAGCSDARLRVITSGRRKGRAPHGFAEALASHNLCPADCSAIANGG